MLERFWPHVRLWPESEEDVVMFLTAVLFLSVGVAVVFLIRFSHQCVEALAATNAECDASETFDDWRLRNLGVYVGLSEEGRMLVGRWLEAHDWFSRTHKFIDGRERREFILSFFDDFPPKHPHGLPRSGNKGVLCDALSLSHTKVNELTVWDDVGTALRILGKKEALQIGV